MWRSHQSRKVRGARPVRFSMSSAITPAPARAEQLVEVLHGFGELDRGTVLDAVLR